MTKRVETWDLRAKVKEARAAHNLLGVVFIEDTHGSYFCSCGFQGKGTSRHVNGLEQRLVANHSDHKYNALEWAEKRKKMRDSRG